MGEFGSVHVVPAGQPEADLLAVGCLEGETPAVDGMEEGIRRAVERLAARGGWKGKDEQLAQTEAGADGPVVSLYGLGARKDLSYAKLARWLHRSADEARHGGARRLAAVLPAHAETSGAAADRVLRALSLSVYRFDRYQSDAEKAGRLERLAVVPPAGEEAAYRDALPTARAVGGAVAFCRDLANSPANEASPAWMEERARELAGSRGMEATVLRADELRARGMGGLLAVGAGSGHEPRMVRLRWGTTGPRVALIGKGITFDTGGISIKPATDMDEMKYDKSGACAVLAAARAVAELALPVRLSVYTPFAENMLSADAYRPSDIVRCYNGKTVGDHRHRRRGADDSRRRPGLGGRGEAGRDGGALHPDRRLRGGARLPGGGAVHPRRGPGGRADRRRSAGGGSGSGGSPSTPNTWKR